MDHRVVEFVEELKSAGGASIRLFDSLKNDPPPGGELAPALAEAMPLASTRGVIDGTTLAICLCTDARYRPIVETLLAEDRIPEERRHYVHFEGGEGLDGEAVVWWFDLLDSRRARSVEMHSLVYTITRRTETLVAHRRARVIELLSTTTRGEGKFTLDALAMTLAVTGPCAPLERQWSGWVRAGLVDGREALGPSPSTTAALHVRYLERCVETGRFTRRWAVIDETTCHWREMLADPARRADALHGLAQVMLDRRTLLGRLPDDVLPALAADPEAAAIEEGFRAAGRGDLQRAGDVAMALLGRLRAT